MTLEETEAKLAEAKAIIQEMLGALHCMPCATRDFLGEELHDRIQMFQYGYIEGRDEEEDEC